MSIKNSRLDTLWNIWYATVSHNYEDLTGLDRPLIRDYSVYDGVVDISVPVSHGLQMMASRCVMGWSGVDANFDSNYTQAGDLPIYRTSYGVLYPSLDVERFCDHWFTHHPQIDIIPRVIDAELQDGQTDALVGEKLWYACEYIKAYDGVYPIVYSRYLLLDAWLQHWTQNMLDVIYYWGARYLYDRTREHPGPPYGTMTKTTTINPDNWIIQQTADRKPPYPGETSRQSIVDWDRWELGTVAEMHQFIETKWGTPTPTPSPSESPENEELKNRVLVLETKVQDLETRVDNLEQDQTTMLVVAKDRYPLRVIVGHDKACDGQTPPGKPIVEPPTEVADRVFVEANQEIRVIKNAKYSCKDNAGDPIVKTASGDHFWVAPGQPGAGQFIPCDFVTTS